MKWLSIMKWLVNWLVIAVTAWGLAGCASNSDRRDPQLLAKVRTELAADYYSRKSYTIALDQLEIAMQADPRYAPAYNVRALVHMALLENDEAESDFQHSLSLDAANPETHNNYGLFLCMRGHERDGIKHFITAAKDTRYATPGTAYLNAGICSKKIGQLQDAEVYFQRALILQPDLVEVLPEIADLAFAQGDYARAKANFASYEKAVSSRLSAQNLLLAARIEHKLGNRSAEAAYAARLRRQFPDSRESNMLGQIR